MSDPINQLVGRRIRLIRTARTLRQEDLAQALGVSTTQVQKYENGTNRVPASRLFKLSQLLEQPVGWFFDEPKGRYAVTAVDPEALQLAQTVMAISDTPKRAALLRLIHALARR
ncbi:helix-turn-helix domain-containing protein [Aestuariibius insulae]|uniref:helix-turn-helix domain-containing protein n=1 Tax=Aestuariibius insulae TaxID=2058287 RepID=UPI00345E4DEA